jgi:Trk K+ transport system NAD-binding subunit
MLGVVMNLVPKSPVVSVGNLASCSAGILEFRLTGPTKLAGKKLKSLSLPPGCKIIGIVRGGEALLPADSTVLQAGDTLVGFVPHSQEEAVRQILLKG